MTKGLIKALNLPSLEEMLKDRGALPEHDAQPDHDDGLDDEDHSELIKNIELASQSAERIDVNNGKDHADAMDVVYKETLKHAQDLMDLGYNMEPARSRGIFEVATTMYGQAISAKNSKRDAQLKAMKLALDQRKLDLDEKRLKAQLGDESSDGNNNTISVDAIVIKEDRNTLIARLRAEKNNKK